MRNMKGKRVVSVLLAMVMVLSMAACGKDKSGIDAVGKGDAVPSMVNAELAKQNVYAAQEINLSIDDNTSIDKAVAVGDKIYMLTSSYSYETSKSTNYLVSMNMDGSGLQQSQLTMGEVEDEEIAEIRAMADAKIAEDPDGQGMDYYFWENNWIGQSTITPDGLLYANRNYNISYDEYGENYDSHYFSKEFLDCWDMDGNLLWEVSLAWMNTEESYSYLTNLIGMPDGKVAMILGGDDSAIVIVDKDGNMSDKKPVNDSKNIFNAYDNMIAKSDGTLLISHYDENDWTKKYLTKFDPAAGQFGESIPITGSVAYNLYNMYEGGSAYDLVYATSDGVYGYNLGDTEGTKFMDFVNSDVGSSNFRSIIMIDDTHFFGLYYDNETYLSVASIFTKVNPEDIKDKAVLVVGGNYIDYMMKKRIVKFNKTSDSYRVVIRDYSVYNTDEDYNAGMTRFSNDIISGNMPDIVCVDSYNMPFSSYVNKGLFVNVDDLIERDPEISKEDLLDNILEAFRYNGKLYQIFPTFSVQTLIGKTSKLGDRTGWTTQEFLDVVRNLPEDCQALSDMTKSNFIYTMMNCCGYDYVDANSGKCSFDSDEFIAMLEFANTLPDDGNGEGIYDEEYWENHWEQSQSQYREDRTLLMSVYIYDFMSMKRNVSGYFGEDVTYIGYPTSNGTGAVVNVDTSYAISAKSANIAGAWDFLKYYFSQEAADKVGTDLWGFSIRKSAFDAKLSDATSRSYWINEKGEKEEYDDYFTVNGEELILDPLTQAQADALYDAMTKVNKRSFYNSAVTDIVTEEAAAFFAGQKSAQDVAGIIQSRVQLYVNENQ